MHHNQPTKHRFHGALARLWSMDRSEFADRLHQEFQKRADAVLFGIGIDPSRSELGLSESRPRKFFFRSEDVPRLLELLRERMPEQAERIIEQAEKICRHRFDLLGYEDLDYGQNIDWHSDRVHGKRAPRDLWFKIRYLDFASVGDAKVTWELNRHQHFVMLAKAYRLTNDHRFARELMDQLRDWHEENPYPRGINWASSLEVAFRSLSWLWVYFLLEGTPAMNADFRKQWLGMIAQSARHIELYLSTYFSPNTHLLGEAVALLFVGTLCPELHSSKRWQRRGWETVLRESQRQVRPDGFYFEQSTYYHVYALDLFLHAGVLSSLNEMPFPPEYNPTLERMLDALAVLCRAGAPPRWGDDDGGRVFDPRRNRAENLRDPLATGAVLFRRGDFKYLASHPREETLWLLGEQGLAEFDRIDSIPPKMKSVTLRDAGFYVLSSGKANLQAIVDAGPQGALAAGHGHADALSLTLHAEGHELLIDPGACEYVGPGTERKEFRVTAAHNSLELNGRSQAEPKGPFAWERLTNARAESWITGETFDFFVGSHDGYSQPDNSVVHRRSVFFRKPKFWLVRDLVLGTGEHQIDVRWHLSVGLPLPSETEGGFICQGENAGISILCPIKRPWSKFVEQVQYSPAYGLKQAASAVRFSTVTTLPSEFATLLAPTAVSQGYMDTHGVLRQVSASPRTSVYHFTDNTEEHCFVFCGEENWVFEGWKSDAEFLYSCGGNGKLSLLILCNGTYVEFRGKEVVSSPKRLSCCEIIRSSGKTQVLCPQDGILVSREEVSRLFETEEVVTHRGDGADR